MKKSFKNNNFVQNGDWYKNFAIVIWQHFHSKWQLESREQVVCDDQTGEDLGKYSKGNWPSSLIRRLKKNMQVHENKNFPLEITWTHCAKRFHNHVWHRLNSGFSASRQRAYFRTSFLQSIFFPRSYLYLSRELKKVLVDIVFKFQSVGSFKTSWMMKNK